MAFCTLVSTKCLISSKLSSGCNTIVGKISNCRTMSGSIRVVAKTFTRLLECSIMYFSASSNRILIGWSISSNASIHIVV